MRCPRGQEGADPLENRLLSALPPPDRSRLSARFERIDLEREQLLYEAGKPIDRVYFPVSGLISVLADFADGRSIEVGTIAHEGIAGLSLFFGSDYPPYRVESLVPGTSLALDRGAFVEELARSEALRSAVGRYARAYLSMTSQIAACNAVHHVKARVARWLLRAHDATGRDDLLLTQEIIAHHLGVERPSVTVAAHHLHERGVIAYARGRVRILDRSALETESCECYRAIRGFFERMLG